MLNAFNLFNPLGAIKAKEKSDEEFNSYGNSYLETLAGQFSVTINKESLELE